MKLYSKYVFTEAAIACCTSVVLFVVLLIAGNAMRDVIDWVVSGKLSLLETAKILAILIPSVTSYALPLGIMTGVLTVVGRMSSQNEILVMKSVGIGLRQISAPIFFISGTAMAFSLYVNLFYAPDSISRYRQTFKNIVRERPMRFLTPHIFNDYFRGNLIYFDGIKDDAFQNIKIWRFDDDGRMDSCVFAKNCTIKFDDSGDRFVLEPKSCIVEKLHKEKSDGQSVPQIIYFESTALDIPAGEIFGRQQYLKKQYKHMTLPELMEKKSQLNKNKDALGYEKIRYEKTLINMQISSHIANAAGILVMTILAIPLGIKTNRASTAINTGIAFSICIGYYFVMMAFSWLGDNPKFRPDILIWIPNIVLLILGSILFKRASRN